MKTISFQTWKSTLAAASLLAIVAGCGGSTYKDPAVVPVAPVSGSVKFNGEIPEGASITLVGGNKTESGISSAAKVKADGTFKISTFGQEDGAPPGDYVVLVQWNKALGGAEGNIGGPNVIPKEYSDAAKTPIKFTVKEGENAIPPIAINSP